MCSSRRVHFGNRLYRLKFSITRSISFYNFTAQNRIILHPKTINYWIDGEYIIAFGLTVNGQNYRSCVVYGISNERSEIDPISHHSSHQTFIQRRDILRLYSYQITNTVYTYPNIETNATAVYVHIFIYQSIH